MFYFLYDILIFLVAVVYFPFYALRGRVHPEIFSRLGFFRRDQFKDLKGQDVVWIHAVSVGEARAAESLVRLIREEWPKKRIVISTVTPTGQALVKKILKGEEMSFYAPVDISFVVEKFLNVINPSLLIIMETEIWPNLIRLSRKHGARVIIVNGRISDSSYRGYNRVNFFFKNILERVDLFCMQTPEAAQRIIALGVSSQQVVMTGNLKFDISSDLKESSLASHLKDLLRDSFLLLAGSTHDNEEEMLIGIYNSLRKEFKSLRLLIAPRHVERIDKIRRMIKLAGLEAINLSVLSKKLLKTLSSSQVLVLDTIGDLNSLYRLCDVAFIGGSLVKKGGHNLIEPALFAKPIIFGKSMDNFKEMRDVFVREKAAVEVDGVSELEVVLRRFLGDPVERKILGDNAKNLLDSNRGAAKRTLGEIEKIVK